MRYSSAVVLSTIAVGGAAAANSHGRHASFHARRQAEVKRSAGSDVNWKAVAYDLKDVDWEKVNWSSVFASTPAAKATPTAAAEQKQYTPAPTPEAKKEAVSSAAPAYSAPAPAASSKAAAPSSSSSSSSSSNAVGNLVSDVMVGVASIANKMGAKIGKNDKSNNGGIWIGSDSAWRMEVTNAGNQESVYWCWKANGYSGMSINANTPDISVGLKPGEKVELSFAPNVPAACSVANANTALALFGGVKNTWAEVTFGKDGAFDVSRNVDMGGSSISMVGSKCTSDMETCVFKCKNGMSTCEAGTDYDLFNCSAGNGGGGGYDQVMKGTGGGCAMGSSGETIKVSFS